MKTILLTNEISKATKAKAAAIGLRLLVKPMIQVAIVEAALPDIFTAAKHSKAEAWVFTSKNAVKAFQKLKNDLDVSNKKFFAVGHKTAEGLKDAGIEVRVPEIETAAALADLIVQHGIASVLFWCGNLRKAELPELLKEKNIDVTELVVYQTGLYPVHITEPYNAVVFLSASAVESFFSVNELPKHTPVFAIGDTTAHELKKYVKSDIIVPEHPDIDLLLQSVGDFFIKKHA